MSLFHDQLPFYVESGGEQVYAPPFLSREVRLYGFVFPIENMAATQRTLDRCLNSPTRGALDYRGVAPFVLVTFARMGPLASLEKPDSDKGFFMYDEAALWVLTASMKGEAGEKRIDDVAWFIPYMFAELSQAVCCGREIFGYPKQYGWVSLPDESSTRNREFSLETVVLREFSPQTRAEKQRLFAVRQIAEDDGLAQKIAREWDDVEDAFKAFSELLKIEGGVPLPNFDLLLHLADYALHREAPMVYLKQFRDAQFGDRACYQSVVEARGKVEAVHRVRSLPGRFQLEIEAAASHPICEDVGLLPSQDALLAFQIDFDLRIECGREVWNSRD